MNIWNRIQAQNITPTMKAALMQMFTAATIFSLGFFLARETPSGEANVGAGTYALFKAATGPNKEEIIYRINTKTGEVWGHSEAVLLRAEDLGLTGKEKDGLNNLISQAKAQGKNVYTSPYWWKTDEETGKPRTYTIR